MKDIITVAKFTMKDMLKRKSFRISTLIILVLIVIGFNIPNILNSVTGGEGFNDTILLVDQDQVFDNQLNSLNSIENLSVKVELGNDNFDSIRDKINNGEISSAIIIEPTDSAPTFRYVVKNVATASNIPEDLSTALSLLYTNVQAQKLGLTPTEAQSLIPDFTVAPEQIEEQEISGNIFVMMLMSIVLFYAIYFCAYQVSSSITVEKTSKIIETLVTSTSPRNIILGKTIGIGLVGLFQMLLIVGTAIISANLFLDHALIASMLDLSNITPLLGLVTLIYFILGYFMYAFAYALTGATISKPEDIQAANTPVALLTLVGFYLAYFTLTDPTSGLNSFAAIFPISSPFCMPIRMMMGLATPLEIIISILVLLVTIFIISRIAIKIYSDAILNYGTRLTLGEILKTYRKK